MSASKITTAQQHQLAVIGAAILDPAACKAYLDSARPTAVNLSWATARLAKVMKNGGDPIAEALAVQAEDIEMCRKISAYGLSLLRDGDGLLTHCNAGELATSRYGTGLGPILLGKEKGYNFKVFSDETRPLLQGARLTSYELEKAGVDVTLICDNMASQVMKNGWIQAVLVGCDRVAMNGDAANKIGTSGVAILAKLETYREMLRPLNLGLEDKMGVQVGSLSGGQRQALALLMATMTPIDFLILDEHTAALDPKTAEIIMELTDQVVKEKKVTTIMVTHNLRYAVEYGNRLIMMHEGKAILDKADEEKKSINTEEIMGIFNKISVECGN